MDTGLLPRADADRLSVLYIADRVGLRIFQSDHRDRQIHFRRVCKLFVVCNDIREEILINMQFIPSLFKCNAVHFLALQRRGHIIRVDLDHIVVPFFLLL